MAVLLSILPSILTGAILFYWQRAQNRRDKELDKRAQERERKATERAKIRKKESLLSLKVSMATLKLTEATAIAVQHHKVNGEMSSAMAACEEARQDYLQMLNEQATENILG